MPLLLMTLVIDMADDSKLSVNPVPLPITIFSFQKVLLSLDTGMACGPNGIPLHILKENASDFVPMLARIFRFILKMKTFPS